MADEADSKGALLGGGVGAARPQRVTRLSQSSTVSQAEQLYLTQDLGETIPVTRDDGAAGREIEERMLEGEEKIEKRRNRSTSAAVLLGLTKTRVRRSEEEAGTKDGDAPPAEGPTDGAATKVRVSRRQGERAKAKEEPAKVAEGAGGNTEGAADSVAPVASQVLVRDTTAGSGVVARSAPGQINPEWLIPFKQGWRREMVQRAASALPKKFAADIYYFGPDGTKLRSLPQILEYLTKTGLPLSSENFSFAKRPIHCPPAELIRLANPKFKPNADHSHVVTAATKRKMAADDDRDSQRPPAKKAKVEKTPASKNKSQADVSFVLSDLQELDREMAAMEAGGALAPPGTPGAKGAGAGSPVRQGVVRKGLVVGSAAPRSSSAVTTGGKKKFAPLKIKFVKKPTLGHKTPQQQQQMGIKPQQQNLRQQVDQKIDLLENKLDVLQTAPEAAAVAQRKRGRQSVEATLPPKVEARSTGVTRRSRGGSTSAGETPEAAPAVERNERPRRTSTRNTSESVSPTVSPTVSPAVCPVFIGEQKTSPISNLSVFASEKFSMAVKVSGAKASEPVLVSAGMMEAVADKNSARAVSVSATQVEAKSAPATDAASKVDFSRQATAASTGEVTKVDVPTKMDDAPKVDAPAKSDTQREMVRAAASLALRTYMSRAMHKPTPVTSVVGTPSAFFAATSTLATSDKTTPVTSHSGSTSSLVKPAPTRSIVSVPRGKRSSVSLVDAGNKTVEVKFEDDTSFVGSGGALRLHPEASSAEMPTEGLRRPRGRPKRGDEPPSENSTPQSGAQVTKCKNLTPAGGAQAAKSQNLTPQGGVKSQNLTPPGATPTKRQRLSVTVNSKTISVRLEDCKEGERPPTGVGEGAPAIRAPAQGPYGSRSKSGKLPRSPMAAGTRIKGESAKQARVKVAKSPVVAEPMAVEGVNTQAEESPTLAVAVGAQGAGQGNSLKRKFDTKAPGAITKPTLLLKPSVKPKTPLTILPGPPRVSSAGVASVGAAGTYFPSGYTSPAGQLIKPASSRASGGGLGVAAGGDKTPTGMQGAGRGAAVMGGGGAGSVNWLRVCGLECPGRLSIPPSLYCQLCMSCFHPECIGFRSGSAGGSSTADFVCWTCRKASKAAESTSYELNNFVASPASKEATPTKLTPTKATPTKATPTKPDGSCATSEADSKAVLHVKVATTKEEALKLVHRESTIELKAAAPSTRLCLTAGGILEMIPPGAPPSGAPSTPPGALHMTGENGKRLSFDSLSDPCVTTGRDNVSGLETASNSELSVEVTEKTLPGAVSGSDAAHGGARVPSAHGPSPSGLSVQEPSPSEDLCAHTLLHIPLALATRVDTTRPFLLYVGALVQLRVLPHQLRRTAGGCAVELPPGALPPEYTRGATVPLRFELKAIPPGGEGGEGEMMQGICVSTWDDE